MLTHAAWGAMHTTAILRPPLQAPLPAVATLLPGQASSEAQSLSQRLGVLLCKRFACADSPFGTGNDFGGALQRFGLALERARRGGGGLLCAAAPGCSRL